MFDQEEMMKIMTICILLMILGGGYGFLSAIQNQNPHYSVSGDLLVSEADRVKAWSWQPSPAWLPSYLLCVLPQNGFGISHTRSGYLFRSQEKRTVYIAGSTILGVGLGCVVAIASGLIQMARRRSNRQIQPIAGKPGSV